MTEGNGHIIDPAGDARRVLQAVVAEQGPEALSNAVIMDGVCQARLSHLPGEAILIGSAARADVPALLRNLIPRLGNYGAIQSVATTLADAHGLDTAACVWVVREFARALGLIASGGTHPAARVEPDGGSGQGTAPPPGPAGPTASSAGAAEGGSAGAGSGAAVSAGPAGLGAAGMGAVGMGAVGMAAAGMGAAGMGATGGPGGGAGPVGVGAGGGAGTGSPGGGGGTGSPGGPGFPGGPGMPGDAGGRPPRRRSSRSGMLSRNTIGIVAAIALVAGYLGVAAVAHLSPFPAKTVAAASSAPPSEGNNSPSPDGSPDPAPDPTPTSDFQILMSKIPGNIKGTNNCANAGTAVGAIAVSECTSLPGLAATTIFYYLFSDSAALGNGFSSFLENEKFKRHFECTTNDKFVSFIPQCESAFTSTSPNTTGSIAEYVNKDNQPIIVTSDNQQQVMAVMVGTNDGDLLAYWKQLQWVVT